MFEANHESELLSQEFLFVKAIPETLCILVHWSLILNPQLSSCCDSKIALFQMTQ